MRSFLLFSLSLFLSFFAKSQNTQWVNYANDHIIYDMALEGDLLWVATQGGLVKIDRVTGEKQTYQPWNSGLRGLGLQSVFVAPDGTKWLGGDNGGLFRFDGTEWEHFYEINTGDVLIQIQNVQVAPDGTVWFLSNTNGTCQGCKRFFSYDGSSFTRHDEIIGPWISTGSIIFDFDIEPTGEVWATNQFEIFKYNGIEVLEKYDSTNSPLKPDEFISAVNLDSQGRLWCATRRTPSQQPYEFRVLRFNGSSWSVMDETAPGWCYVIEEDSDGNMWFEFRDDNSWVSQIARFNGFEWQYWEVDDLPGMPDSYNEPDLLEIDEEGHWWVSLYSGIHNKKIYEYDGSIWTGYDTEIFPMVGNYWECAAFDCEGRLWIGSHNGINVFDGTTWVEYQYPEIAGNGSVWSITLDEATCDLYIAFYSGNDGVAASRFDGNSFHPILLPNGTGSAFKAKVGPDGTLWVASTQDGLGQFDGINWTWLNEQNSIVPDFTYDLDVDQQGNVWVGTYGGGLIRYDGAGGWQQFDSSNSPLEDHQYWVFVDDSGMVWTHRHEQGVARFDGTSWEILQIPNPIVQASSMAEDAEHNFWIGGYGESYYWDGVDFSTFNITNSPIASNSTREVVIDPYGNTWFVHSNRGISVYNENGISNQLTSPTPGARGTVFFDFDQNGQMGTTNEPPMSGQKVWLQPNNLLSFTNGAGRYTFYPTPGDYEVSYGTENPYLPTTSNPLEFQMADQPIDGLDFGVWTNDLPDSVSLDLTAGFARCNEHMNLWATFCNFGILDAEGTVEITFDPLLEYVSAFPEPQSVQGNVVTFAFEDLSYFECQTVKIVLQVPGVDDLGQILQFSGTGTGIFLGEIVSTAWDDARAEIACSFDPNDKRSEATGDHVDEFSLLDDPLDYTIRFQNKGNDTAFIVVIRDTLDANLDRSTLQVVASSHDMETLLDANGLLTFTFRSIDLLWEAVDEPGSQGFVKYRIAPKAGLPDPTEIRNTAHIYFDLNPPIVTNTTQNVLVETLPFSATNNAETKSSLLAFPNPTSDNLWVEFRQNEFENAPYQLTVHDLSGQQVLIKKSVTGRYRIENLPEGFYILTAIFDGKKESLKVVVSR